MIINYIKRHHLCIGSRPSEAPADTYAIYKLKEAKRNGIENELRAAKDNLYIR